MASERNIIRFDNGELNLKEIRFKNYETGETSNENKLSYKFKTPSIDEFEYTISILNEIFPNEEILEYFLEFLSGLLIKGNPSKIITIFQGAGVLNVKRLLKDLFENYISEEIPNINANIIFISQNSDLEKLSGEFKCVGFEKITHSNTSVMNRIRVFPSECRWDFIPTHLNIFKNTLAWINFDTYKYMLINGRMKEPEGIINSTSENRNEF